MPVALEMATVLLVEGTIIGSLSKNFISTTKRHSPCYKVMDFVRKNYSAQTANLPVLRGRTGTL